jgi:hypothetical protein
MSSDLTPEQRIEMEDLEQDNQNAINSIRSMTPDLWAVLELERSILSGNNHQPSDVFPADAGSSDQAAPPLIDGRARSASSSSH